jgi:hypothetical protein
MRNYIEKLSSVRNWQQALSHMLAMTSDVPRPDLNIFGGKTVRNLSLLGGITSIPTQMPNASLGIVELMVVA